MEVKWMSALKKWKSNVKKSCQMCSENACYLWTFMRTKSSIHKIQQHFIKYQSYINILRWANFKIPKNGKVLYLFIFILQCMRIIYMNSSHADKDCGQKYSDLCCQHFIHLFLMRKNEPLKTNEFYQCTPIQQFINSSSNKW